MRLWLGSILGHMSFACGVLKCGLFTPSFCLVQLRGQAHLKMPPLKMLCLGCSHQRLSLAGLSLPLLSSASAFLTYSTELYEKDKPNNATENSHNSACSCSSLCRSLAVPGLPCKQTGQFDQSPLTVPLKKDSRS